MVAALSGLMDVGQYRLALENNADALDAAVCVLGATDFLEGRALPPLDAALAERDGWIWASARQQ